MVAISDIRIGETYRFVIDQRGEEYTATIEMDTGMSPTTGTAVGMVRDSSYPTGGWEGNQFRIHEDGTVEQTGGDPFGPIGEVVRVDEV